MSFRIGIALGGGSARGLAHVGVLRELVRAQIPINCVAGTSIGSIIGSIYARRANIDDVEIRLNNFFKSDIFRNAQLHTLAQKEDESGGWLDSLSWIMRKAALYTQGATSRSMIDAEEYENIIKALVEDIEIGDLKLPFAASATDILGGREAVFTRGSLRLATQSSCAIPGVFSPVEDGGRLLVDGGWVDLVPVEPCRSLGADYVIAVDISQDLDDDVDLRRSINIVLRTNAVTRVKLRELQLQRADYIIRPAVGAIHWADFSRIDDIVECGVKAARESAEKIKQEIKKRRRWRFFSR